MFDKTRQARRARTRASVTRKLQSALTRTIDRTERWLDDGERVDAGRGALVFWSHLFPNGRATTNGMERQAYFLAEASRLDEAVILQKNAHQRRIITQGPEHPATLVSECLLGLYFLQSDRYEEASAALEHALTADPTQYLADLGFSTRVLAALVDALRFQERFIEAERILDEIIATCRELLGDDHIKTYTAKFQLSRVLAYGGEQERALILRRQLLEACIQALDPDDRFIISARYGLAYSLTVAGEYKEARILATAALADSRRLRDDDHPDTVGLEELLHDIGRFDGNS